MPSVLEVAASEAADSSSIHTSDPCLVPPPTLDTLPTELLLEISNALVASSSRTAVESFSGLWALVSSCTALRCALEPSLRELLDLKSRLGHVTIDPEDGRWIHHQLAAGAGDIIGWQRQIHAAAASKN